MPASGLMGDSDSETGFCEAIASAQPPLILRHDGTREGILRHLESSQWLKTPPTGFLVARSAHALTVLTFLVRHGAEFPSKFSVISRDDDEFLNFATPDIARYKTDPALFARQISRAALKMARSGAVPAPPVRLMPVFHPGNTA
jgi:DNA-binding LacI/PurR family transcriptional regulator